MSMLPEGEDLRRAVKWISETRQDEPEKKVSELVQEACLKFDLSPGDAAFLEKFCKKNPC